jgi:RHH-type proline utilization regulon transcriptional repressor/proline dehydrogenase/delta 1-pyrroline-5-carboxylate dehydrogenase
VNRIADDAVPVDDLIEDPVALVRSMPMPGAGHDRIARPRDLFGAARPNSAGLDLTDESVLAELATSLPLSAGLAWTAVPSGRSAAEARIPVLNPADHRDVVGHVRDAEPADIGQAMAAAEEAGARWAQTPPAVRAGALRAAANAFEARMPILLGLIVREAGKSLANAIAEVREAVDFLRYYAGEAERLCDPGTRPLGPVACISPWNFPLAIFTGQVAAALAAGNTVLAKPAEETPLVAAEAVRLLIAAGIPADVLHLLPGEGEVGAALVGDPRVQGVLFTGSTAVARTIQATLVERLTPDGRPVPLIAETGGQNAMIVDSSALPEQVVADVIASAFDSAGQRCSALRILCIQEDIAERTLALLHGALHELEVGDPRRLSVDIGPVITAGAAEGITRHIVAMRARGHRVTQFAMATETSEGTFVSPTVIEISRIADVEAEVFGPVLHVLRYRREGLDALIADINGTGYGLTFGLHTRIEETVTHVLGRVAAGNLYVNRNIIGAVVGVQPFGGAGLSGTGPKAGGPRYLCRLMTGAVPALSAGAGSTADAAALAFIAWLRERAFTEIAARVTSYVERTPLGLAVELPGPVGERNTYSLHPRGRIAAVASSEPGILIQLGAILATGQTALLPTAAASSALLDDLPEAVRRRIAHADDPVLAPGIGGVLFEGEESGLMALNRRIAGRDGAIIPVWSITSASRAGEDYEPSDLLEERTVTINTAAAGGNASLMALDA